jgi:Ca-activated chloride channel homolog
MTLRPLLRQRNAGLPVIAAILALESLAGARQRPAPPPIPTDQVFQSEVEVVTVTATVLDAEGRLAPNLAQSDFELFETGERQTITQFTRQRVPVSLVVLLDISDSMYGQRIADARTALDRFLFELLSAEDEYSLLLFNHQPLLAAAWTNKPDDVRPHLAKLRPWGGTAIYDALVAAAPLFDRRHRQRGAALLISDGADTASDQTLRQVKSVLLRADAFVYAIAIDPPNPRAINTRVNPYTLREITNDSGGYTEVVHDSLDLGPATARIAEELNQQYTLGYTPTRAPDGDFRSIRLKVNKPGYQVRARRGYVATIKKKSD